MKKKKYNERTLEDYKKEYYSRFPKSQLEILDFVDTTKVKVNSRFGICIFPKKTLLKGAKDSIKSAINKNEYFINQLKEIYSNNYLYNLINYTSFKEKVILICKIHGNFTQRSDYLLNNIACPQCGRRLNSIRMKENPTGWNYEYWEKAGLKSKTFESF